MKHLMLFAVLCFFSLLAYAQFSQHPPEPRMDHETGHDGPRPCDNVDDGTPLENEDGTIPPPVGLCLPINDYLYPLLILGILYGAYEIQKVQTARKSLE